MPKPFAKCAIFPWQRLHLHLDLSFGLTQHGPIYRDRVVRGNYHFDQSSSPKGNKSNLDLSLFLAPFPASGQNQIHVKYLPINEPHSPDHCMVYAVMKEHVYHNSI